MNESVINVLRGFIHLSEQDRREFLREVTAYTNQGYLQKAQTERLVEQRNTGPKNTLCNCCGR